MSTSACPGYYLSRRSMLAAGGATLLGMSVKSLLAATGKDHAAKAEHVILFWNGGGMSHIDTWDPKPGRPTGGELGGIKTSVSGLEISSIFPQLAKQMHHCSLIRSIAGTQGDHGLRHESFANELSAVSESRASRHWFGRHARTAEFRRFACVYQHQRPSSASRLFGAKMRSVLCFQPW